MSQIVKKFVQDNAIGSAKIRLENNQPLKARNAADSANIDVLKVNASDQVEVLFAPDVEFKPAYSSAYWGAPTPAFLYKEDGADQAMIIGNADCTSATTPYFALMLMTGANVGNGGSTGSYTGEIYLQTGAADGSTDTGGIYISTGVKTGSGGDSGAISIETGNGGATGGASGDITIKSGGGNGSGGVSVFSGSSTGNTGSIDLSSGASTNGISGNVVVQAGSGVTPGSVQIKTGDASGLATASGTILVKTGDSGLGNTGAVEVASGNATSTFNSGNVKLKTGTVASGTRGSVLIEDVSLAAASNGYVWALQDNTTGRGAWVAASGGGTPKKETFTLSAGDITNQYLDLTQVAKTDSIHFVVKGGAPTVEGASHDYSVNYTGGVAGKTRITFLNDLATGGGAALVAGDVVQIVYIY